MVGKPAGNKLFIVSMYLYELGGHEILMWSPGGWEKDDPEVRYEEQVLPDGQDLICIYGTKEVNSHIKKIGLILKK